MIKNNKLKVIISSLIILLPIFIGLLMWNQLPNMMQVHWGLDGSADGVQAKVFAVFIFPIILLLFHFVCLFLTFLDKKQNHQNKKALGIIFWIVPFTSLFSNGIIYATAMGKEFNIKTFVPISLGLMFIFIGNYLPKIKQNRTLGIKISWTLNNEENWNKTHRLAGKVWVIGGLVFILSIFLPNRFIIPVISCVMLALMVIPMIYSYFIYKKHKEKGILYIAESKSKLESYSMKISAVLVPIILVAVGVLMFTGDISIQYEDNGFSIDATYWTDLKIDYEEIDSIQYLEEFNKGARSYGFGSSRLSMGNFQNNKLGNYTLYSYNQTESYVLLEIDGKILVINGKDEVDTRNIYEKILDKIK